MRKTNMQLRYTANKNIGNMEKIGSKEMNLGKSYYEDVGQWMDLKNDGMQKRQGKRSIDRLPLRWPDDIKKIASKLWR